MNTPFDLSKLGEKTVYVRPMQAEDLPREIRAHARFEGEIYAIHGPNGEYLGLAPTRALAFHFARVHEFAPVSVH